MKGVDGQALPRLSPADYFVQTWGVLVAAYLVLGALHGYAVRAESEAPQAIALPTKLEVREGPGNHRKTLFVVQGGSRVRIVDRGTGWLRIRLPDGLEGWAPQADLGELAGAARRAS